MTSLLLAVALQSVYSVQAGLVNYVEGPVNVVLNENVPEGAPIETGENGFAEILLNPGSFLRLGHESTAVLEDTSLAAVRIRLVWGTALIEAAEIRDEFPITVVTGDLTTRIREDGLYRFADGRASVLDGRLDVPNSDLTYEKGWSLFFDRVYRAIRTDTDELAGALDGWSSLRAAVLASANSRAYQAMTRGPALSSSVYPDLWAWYWLPGLGTWTFFPTRFYQSPYGYSYYPLSARSGRTISPSGRVGGGGGSGGTPVTRPGPQPQPSTGGGGGGIPSPPAPTFGDIVPSRSGPATQQPN